PPGDAAGKPHHSSPAGAGTPHGRHAIPRAVADDGHTPSAKISEDELAIALFARLAGRRVDHLGDELRFIDVDAVTRRAREAMRTDFGRTGVVECLIPEVILYTHVGRWYRCDRHNVVSVHSSSRSIAYC